MNKNILIIILVFLSIITSSIATDEIVYEQNTNITLYQVCDTCSYVNLESIIYPSGNVVYLNSSMTKEGYSYTYNFSNTSELGQYFYFVCGDKNDDITCETLSFLVSNSGENTTSEGGAFYIALIFIFVVFFIVSLIFAFNLDGENQFTMGEKGDPIFEMNFNKYIKLGLYLLSYFFFWILTWTSWEISKSFLLSSKLFGLLKSIFIIETILLFPIILFVIVIGTMKIIADSELMKLTKRGLFPRK